MVHHHQRRVPHLCHRVLYLCTELGVSCVQSVFFPIPRDRFDLMIYGFVGLFKLFFIVFSLVPYLALLIIG